VSLVSVQAQNWTQTAEIGEGIETGEIVEIVNTDAAFMQVAEKMVGCSKGLGEYPTLSAIFSFVTAQWVRRSCQSFLRLISGQTGSSSVLGKTEAHNRQNQIIERDVVII